MCALGAGASLRGTCSCRPERTRSGTPYSCRSASRSLFAKESNTLELLDRPMWIQDDCWLGVNAVICPGVAVRMGSIVGANAAVTRDVAPYSVVGGVPARVLGTHLNWHPPEQIDIAKTEDLVTFYRALRYTNSAGRWPSKYRRTSR
jgi:hypothetical protein